MRQVGNHLTPHGGEDEAFLALTLDQADALLASRSFHALVQDLIDAGLVANALPAQPVEDIMIQANRDGLFGMLQGRTATPLLCG